VLNLLEFMIKYNNGLSASVDLSHAIDGSHFQMYVLSRLGDAKSINPEQRPGG
jgi:hypothetical protein